MQPPQHTLPHLPEEGWGGTAWGRQGGMRKMAQGSAWLQHLGADTGQCSVPSCSLQQPAVPQHSIPEAAEQLAICHCSEGTFAELLTELEPPKPFPCYRIHIPCWTDPQDQLPNSAPGKSTRPLHKPARWRLWSYQDFHQICLESYQGRKGRRKRKGEEEKEEQQPQQEQRA